MLFPFGFSGVVRMEVGVNSIEALVRSLVGALMNEGGTEVEQGDGLIHFRGLTGTMSSSPLVNIERGTLNLGERTTPVEIAYDVEYERWMLLGLILFPLAGIGNWLGG